MSTLVGRSELEKEVIAYMNDRYLNLGPRDGSPNPKEQEISDRYVLDFLLGGKYLDTETGKVENSPFEADKHLYRTLQAYGDHTGKGFVFLHENPTDMHKRIARKLIRKVEETEFTNAEYAGNVLVVLDPNYEGLAILNLRKKRIEKYKFKGERWFKKLTLRRANGKVKKKVLKYAREAYAESKGEQ